MRVLLVKMSSLGDIVHTLAAVQDASRHGVEFDWVVEEDFAAVARLHPSVKRTIPIALRRWRKTPVASFNDLRRFRVQLREHRYDLVIDAQGLTKSAVVGRWARTSAYAGFDRHSAREPAAAAWYRIRLDVPKENHAIDRLRQLFARAIGYDPPEYAPEFGIEGADVADSYGVLLHGTTWQTKLWPEHFWIVVGTQMSEMGIRPTLAWGNAEEKSRAERIASAVPGAEVLEPMALQSAVELLRGSRATVGVDSGLAHLSAALGRPTVMLFGPTFSGLTGCRGPRAVNLQSRLTCSPCLGRVCRYAGRPLSWRDREVRPACFASVDPERVMAAVRDCRVSAQTRSPLPRGIEYDSGPG